MPTDTFAEEVTAVETSAEDIARTMDKVAADPELRMQVLHKLLGEGACRQIGIYPIPTGFKLSVVIPVYNEERWIREVVRRVQAVDIPKEIVIVEDCSKDNTRDVLREIEAAHDNVRVFYQPRNLGKGAALREGFKHATGDVVLVQ